MGNRAVITDIAKKEGVYVHWNGGRDSIEPLLTYCKLRNLPSPEIDNSSWKKFVDIVIATFNCTAKHNYYECMDTDNGDNGVYVIENWQIVERLHYEGDEQNGYDPHLVLDKIHCEVEKTKIFENKTSNEFNVGDYVYVITKETLNPIKMIKIKEMIIDKDQSIYNFDFNLEEDLLQKDNTFDYPLTNLVFNNVEEAKKYFKELISNSDVEKVVKKEEE